VLVTDGDLGAGPALAQVVQEGEENRAHRFVDADLGEQAVDRRVGADGVERGQRFRQLLALRLAARGRRVCREHRRGRLRGRQARREVPLHPA
jgi:hypothetical protein